MKKDDIPAALLLNYTGISPGIEPMPLELIQLVELEHPLLEVLERQLVLELVQVLEQLFQEKQQQELVMKKQHSCRLHNQS